MIDLKIRKVSFGRGNHHHYRSHQLGLHLKKSFNVEAKDLDNCQLKLVKLTKRFGIHYNRSIRLRGEKREANDARHRTQVAYNNSSLDTHTILLVSFLRTPINFNPNYNFKLLLHAWLLPFFVIIFVFLI